MAKFLIKTTPRFFQAIQCTRPWLEKISNTMSSETAQLYVIKRSFANQAVMKHMLLVSQQTQKNLTDQKRYYNERNPAGGYDIEEDRYRGNQVRNREDNRNPAGGYDIEEDRYQGNQVGRRQGNRNNFRDRSEGRNYSRNNEFRNSSESFGGREENDLYSRNQSQYGGDSEIRSRDWDLGSSLEEENWENVKLKRLQKNVFNPLQSSKARSGEEVDAFRKENRITIVQGNVEVPNPIVDFEEAGFPEDIVRKLKDSGFLTPMPIQAQGWPIVMSGRDLIGIGQTGSGKTLGYVLPAIMHIISHPQKVSAKQNSSNGPLALVLAPTRELAQQIETVAREFSRGSLRIRTTCVFGGANKGPQIRDLDAGVDLVVATPGRLIDLLEMNVTTLRQCSYVVLDEADRMLDMGFEPQIRKILGQIRPDRQMLMWSATWPDDVKDLAEDFLAAAHSEKAEEHVQLNIGSIELQAASSIQQNFEVMTGGNYRGDKQRRLIELLENTKSHFTGADNMLRKVLIFAQTKKDVDFLERIIRREGHNASAIHGGKTQMQRDNVLSRFRSGKSPILIATDVAARGLDVNDIDCVINYEFPTNVEDYVHRIGRTGRAGKNGISHTFLDEENGKVAKELIKVLKKAGQSVPADLEDLANRYSPSRSKQKPFQSNSFHSRNPRRFDSGDRYNRDFERRTKRFNLSYEE